jgi:PadR family transcriptional regulator, regulatory protein PadR
MIKNFRNNNKKIEEFITSCSRQRRFLVPAMLLLLAEKSTHGYLLIEKYSSLGFTDANSDAGAVYRTLKILDSKGFIKSEWETDKPGAAKKIYSITEPGLILLKRWMAEIRERKKTLELFINRFENLS